jgi:hypothetical protein
LTVANALVLLFCEKAILAKASDAKPRVLASSATPSATPRRTHDSRAAEHLGTLLQENVMLWMKKIPVSVALLALLVFYYAATGAF